jgi:hypothetical protein
LICPESSDHIDHQGVARDAPWRTSPPLPRSHSDVFVSQKGLRLLARCSILILSSLLKDLQEFDAHPGIRQCLAKGRKLTLNQSLHSLVGHGQPGFDPLFPQGEVHLDIIQPQVNIRCSFPVEHLDLSMQLLV